MSAPCDEKLLNDTHKKYSNPTQIIEILNLPIHIYDTLYKIHCDIPIPLYIIEN